jgi:hypothetical protein
MSPPIVVRLRLSPAAVDAAVVLPVLAAAVAAVAAVDSDVVAVAIRLGTARHHLLLTGRVAMP